MNYLFYLKVRYNNFSLHNDIKKGRVKCHVQSFQASRFGGRSPAFLRNNENLPTSRFGMKISRFISTVKRQFWASAVNRQFRQSSSRQNDFQFDSLVVHIAVTSFIPRSRHYIRRDALRAHACVEHAKPLFRAALDRH